MKTHSAEGSIGQGWRIAVQPEGPLFAPRFWQFDDRTNSSTPWPISERNSHYANASLLSVIYDSFRLRSLSDYYGTFFNGFLSIPYYYIYLTRILRILYISIIINFSSQFFSQIWMWDACFVTRERSVFLHLEKTIQFVYLLLKEKLLQWILDGLFVFIFILREYRIGDSTWPSSLVRSRKCLFNVNVE